jgi:Uma2 family endonuclease
MLDETLRLPTQYDLPDTDYQPVDNELQVSAPVLLRAILALLWANQRDWFFAINLGLYYEPGLPAIGPDAFLSLGVPRIGSSGKMRLSYVVWEEKVLPQWVLEIVSMTPGGEYTDKLQKYRDMGVLYYTIYNPDYAKRDRHPVLEVYRLTNGVYVSQPGNPVWMPELGLGIGDEVGTHEGITQPWLYWYDAAGHRYPAPEDTIAQERARRLAATRQQLIEQERADRAELAQRSMVVRQLTRRLGSLPESWVQRVNALPIDELAGLGEALMDFESIGDLSDWWEKGDREG